ncbi:MAG: transposase, partial [Nanoarchaeota archaeon]
MGYRNKTIPDYKKRFFKKEYKKEVRDMSDQQFMERRIKQADRKQMVLKSVEVDKLVEEDHEVRAIWEMVKRLDLSSYYESIRAMEGSAGRSATDPVVLISLWIYAYSKGVSAAREIERLCEQDSAYQWITGLEVINYHTLSDFRIKNQEGLNKIFTDILGILSGEGLITLERVMHDGTKIKAYASGDTFRREERIQKHLEAAREQVRIMETTSEDEMSQRISKSKQRGIKEKKKRLEQALEELEKIKESKKEKEK